MNVVAQILYIDDDPLNCCLMKRVLEADGYAVSLASNGVTGLARASVESPDLILLDINMPDLDGYEVARSLRGMEHTMYTPILFVSANQSEETKILQAGGNGYIAKPIDVDRIAKQISAFL